MGGSVNERGKSIGGRSPKVAAQKIKSWFMLKGGKGPIHIVDHGKQTNFQPPGWLMEDLGPELSYLTGSAEIAYAYINSIPELMDANC